MKIFIGIRIGTWSLGFEYNPIVHKDGGPYMTRWILYLVFFNIRLHQFFRGDYDRESHNHPWWFITIPFTPYMERVYERGKFIGDRVVKAWHPHFRGMDFEHIVTGPVERLRYVQGGWCLVEKPFWTLVIAGRPSQTWGFYSSKGKFRPYGNE